MREQVILVLTLLFTIVAASYSHGNAQDPQKLVQDAFNYWRGNASISTVVMTIQRPEWQRAMTLKAWTRGETDSLFRIIDPPKDSGNGTLKKGREMWMFNPKINRIIKLPPSMMSQAWMGSDFSNNDLAKSDSLLNDYIHKITGTETNEGKKLYIHDEEATWHIGKAVSYIRHVRKQVLAVIIKIRSEKSDSDNNIIYIKEKTLTFYIAEDQEGLILWRYVGDPDYSEYFDFIKRIKEG